MNGDSFGYLSRLLDPDVDDRRIYFDEMRDKLIELGYHDIANDMISLMNRLDEFRNVWYEVEQFESGDHGEESVADAVRHYRLVGDVKVNVATVEPVMAPISVTNCYGRFSVVSMAVDRAIQKYLPSSVNALANLYWTKVGVEVPAANTVTELLVMLACADRDRANKHSSPA